jgi:hypothetical protein
VIHIEPERNPYIREGCEGVLHLGSGMDVKNYLRERNPHKRRWARAITKFNKDAR